MKKIIIIVFAIFAISNIYGQVLIGATKYEIKTAAWQHYNTPFEDWQDVTEDLETIAVRIPQLDGTIAYYFQDNCARNCYFTFVTESYTAYERFFNSRYLHEFGELQSDGTYHTYDDKYKVTKGKPMDGAWVLFYESKN